MENAFVSGFSFFELGFIYFEDLHIAGEDDVK